ncbi:MAG: hypothetical protein CVU00_04565 [Bacteroidetes bacterium HGW-Bacteroidetes-17]|jgi:hypothetical protein|nr:MAG: hypothetical protein CVU00_04565 [Bacteroidetes bacterium HGW-Bacteroidetes-17]
MSEAYKGIRFMATAWPDALIEIDFCRNCRILQLPDANKRFEYPHLYKMGLSESLMNLRD